jgi:hypothetical protein
MTVARHMFPCSRRKEGDHDSGLTQSQSEVAAAAGIPAVGIPAEDILAEGILAAGTLAGEVGHHSTPPGTPAAVATLPFEMMSPA